MINRGDLVRLSEFNKDSINAVGKVIEVVPYTSKPEKCLVSTLDPHGKGNFCGYVKIENLKKI